MALLNQQVWADEQGVAGEGGEALVGGIAIASGAQGQHLPDALPCLVQKINEMTSFGPKVANAIAAW